MALTKAEWLENLRSWVPRWFLDSPAYQEATFSALAQILSDAQAEAEEQSSQTYLSDSEKPYLDLHGDERNTARLTNESDQLYRVRITNLTNKSNKPAIQAIVSDLLINGAASVLEDFESDIYFGRSAYMNRAHLFIEKIKNAFSVVIDNQTHSPFSFFGREHFMDREDFAGTLEAPQELFDAILEAIKNVKAFGTLFRVVERAG